LLLLMVVVVLFVLFLSWFVAISERYHRLDFFCRQPVFTVVLACLNQFYKCGGNTKNITLQDILAVETCVSGGYPN